MTEEQESFQLPAEIDIDELVKIANQFDDGHEKLLPTWGYIILFFVPALLTFFIARTQLDWDPLFAGITALAIMNGSINMVIAWLTIRLDGHSNEALDHLETVMSGMDKLEDTLDEANTMVSTFSDDLGEARDLLKRVGVDLKDLELEAVADVVGSLKDNRDDLNSILLNLREVDVQHYINEAKQIDWDALLAGINDVMAFIKAKQGEEDVVRKPISQTINVMPSFDDIPDDDDLIDFDDDFESDADDEYSLMPMPAIKEPKPTLSLKRDKPKGGLSLKRNR
jgi:hypothetical protein|tara:strand:+ start:3892 stop:4737 length:846 start_codon:yes stop_codon:yes gene_type:complete